jgi:hypothetical protein
MTRVEISIRRLFVHGRERFDAEAFCGALKQEVGQHLREGGTLAGTGQNGAAASVPPARPVVAPEFHAARPVARRLFK